MMTICQCWKCSKQGLLVIDRFTLLSDIQASGMIPSYIVSAHDFDTLRWFIENDHICVKWSSNEAWLTPWAKQQIAFGRQDAFTGGRMVSIGGALGNL